MGLAIIVPDVSFGDANLGKVTFSGNVPIRGLSINLKDSYIGTTVDLKCSYLPANTTQRDVVWSIESGSEYASISGSKLTILSGASHNDVTIKCTSVLNPTVTTEKTIAVTYSETGYSYVKYISVVSSDGGVSSASYVDTSIKPKAGQTIEITGGFKGTPGNGGLFGARNSTQSDRCMTYRDKDEGKMIIFSPTVDNFVKQAIAIDGSLNTYRIIPISPYAQYKLEGSDIWNAFFENKDFQGVISNNIDYPYYLFVTNTGGTPTVSSVMEVMISRFKIWENNELVIDLRAIAIGDTPYFRDEVSGNLYPIVGNSTVTFEEYE